MKKQIFVFITFCLLVGLVVFLGKNTSAQEEKTQQVLDVACIAKDSASWKDCIQQVQDGKNSFVKITALIPCNTQDDCAVTLSNIQHTVLIYGAINTENGFQRVHDYSYPILTIKDSTGVSIGGFLIDDSADAFCPSGATCVSPIQVSGSNKTLIESAIFTLVKGSAIEVVQSSNTHISKSVFRSSENHAIDVRASQDTIIDNNTITDSGSEAIVYASLGTKNSIRNNTLTHNHKNDIYNGCVGICNGAQLSILPNTSTVLITKNTISNGYNDLYNSFGLYVSGIEISGRSVENATISCNRIMNNTGNGVAVSNRTSSTKQIILKQNTIYGNGINTNFYTQPTDQIENNCFDTQCSLKSC